jgi:hypothetical protein
VKTPGSGTQQGWCARVLRQLSPQSSGPGAGVQSLSWIGQERIAIGSVPPSGSVADLASQGVTHVVNCRTHGQVWLRGDLMAERAVFGVARAAHAPMQDLGWLALQIRPIWPGAAA